jgi:hypothetical protein
MNRKERRVEESRRRRNVDESVKAMEKKFEERFGRPMRDGDPLLWDENAPGDDPVRLTDDQFDLIMGNSMREAGIPDHLIFVYERTGLILDEFGYKTASPKIRALWDQAMRAYETLSEQERKARQKA